MEKISNIERRNNSNKKIKQLGREVKDYDDEIWSRRRFKVVLFGAREKFNQNYQTIWISVWMLW